MDVMLTKRRLEVGDCGLKVAFSPNVTFRFPIPRSRYLPGALDGAIRRAAAPGSAPENDPRYPIPEPRFGVRCSKLKALKALKADVWGGRLWLRGVVFLP
jgi:hypothetical protein